VAKWPDIRDNLDLITSLGARTRVPTIYPYRYMVAAGGLISYGIDSADLYQRAPAYIDRILKGTKPADLPVQLPTKFELAVNLKTAKALGIDIPATLLGRRRGDRMTLARQIGKFDPDQIRNTWMRALARRISHSNSEDTRPPSRGAMRPS
jgi:hypothetical protein